MNKLQVLKYQYKVSFCNAHHNPIHIRLRIHLGFLPTYLASISAFLRFGLSNRVTISNELTLRDSNNSVMDFNVVPVSKISSIMSTSLFSIDEPKSLII